MSLDTSPVAAVDAYVATIPQPKAGTAVLADDIRTALLAVASCLKYFKNDPTIDTSLTIANGAKIELASDSDLNIRAGSNVNAVGGGKITVDASSAIFLADGANITIPSGVANVNGALSKRYDALAVGNHTISVISDGDYFEVPAGAATITLSNGKTGVAQELTIFRSVNSATTVVVAGTGIGSLSFTSGFPWYAKLLWTGATWKFLIAAQNAIF